MHFAEGKRHEILEKENRNRHICRNVDDGTFGLCTGGRNHRP